MVGVKQKCLQRPPYFVFWNSPEENLLFETVQSDPPSYDFTALKGNHFKFIVLLDWTYTIIIFTSSCYSRFELYLAVADDDKGMCYDRTPSSEACYILLNTVKPVLSDHSFRKHENRY